MLTKAKKDKADKKAKQPMRIHSLVIIVCIILAAALMTWILPAGEYDRYENAQGKLVVDPTSYHHIEKNPATIGDVLLAVPKGLQEAAGLVFLVLIIGGSFSLINSTNAIRAFISKFLGSLRSDRGLLLIPLVMLPFFAMPAITGNGESMLAFLPVGILIARSMGLDAMSGICMVTIAGSTGFATGLFNAASTGTAQTLMGLPIFSGLWFRMVGAVLLFITGATITVLYARRVKKDPTKSVCYNVELANAQKEQENPVIEMTTRHKIIIVEFLCGLGVIIYAALNKWPFTTHFPAIFMTMALVIGFTAGYSANRIADEFVKGTQMILVGALVVGFARGISIILLDGHIIDTIVYGLASVFSHFPKPLAGVAMLIVQSIINCFIISASGQAAATIPIMEPLGEVLGITKQTVVMAFIYGDGFSNIMLPMNASIMGACAISGLSYGQYIKQAWKYYVAYMAVGAIMLIAAVAIKLGPF